MKKKSITETKKIVAACRKNKPLKETLKYNINGEDIVINFDFNLTPGSLDMFEKIVESGPFYQDEIGNDVFQPCYDHIYYYYAILHCFSDLKVNELDADSIINLITIIKDDIDNVMCKCFGYENFLWGIKCDAIKYRLNVSYVDKCMTLLSGIIDVGSQADRIEDILTKVNDMTTVFGDSKYTNDEVLDIANGVVKKADQMELVRAIIDSQKKKNTKEIEDRKANDTVKFPEK